MPNGCLPGLFGASDHWERLVEAVSPRCHAMALSLPVFETPYHEGSAPAVCTDRPPGPLPRLGGPGSGLVLSKTGPLPSSLQRGAQHSGRRHNGVVTTQLR